MWMSYKSTKELLALTPETDCDETSRVDGLITRQIRRLARIWKNDPTKNLSPRGGASN
jgi:hypothetical protein